MLTHTSLVNGGKGNPNEAAISVLDSMSWRIHDTRLIELAAVNGSSLDFMLFPTIWYASQECGFAVTLVTMMMSI